ncbi:MAG: ATP-dependent DNA helicase RecG [Actinomycetota bacterium]
MSDSDLLGRPLERLIGPKTAKAFEEAFGYSAVADLLTHYPRRYIRRGELTPIDEIPVGSEATILAEILSVKVKKIPRRKGGILEVVVTDGQAKLLLTFFNQVWRERELKVGREGLFAGKITLFNGKRQLSHPEYHLIPDGDNVDGAIDDFAGRLIPIYPATSKLPSWKIEQSIEILLDQITELEDLIPKEILESEKLISHARALRQVHQPDDLDSAREAKRRLTFDEAFILQLILVKRRQAIRLLHSHPIRVGQGRGLLARFDAALPFTLTAGQKRVWQEIASDLASEGPMYRLLQGEVGSGKTILALRAMVATADASGQAALLAPTEVLATQHYRNLLSILGPLAEAGMLGSEADALRVELLTGSLSQAEKKRIHDGLRDGSVDLVIGTHALISEGVEFARLDLLVIDEQHRFGVEQRDALRERSENSPHILVMTATPIPRTVAMTVFGDLDVSVLDELPQGRSPISTHIIPVLSKPHFLDRAWMRIREEVAKGRQAYVVAPRIAPSASAARSDESESDSKDEKKMRERVARLLAEELPDGIGEVESGEQMASVEEFFGILNDGPLKGLRIAALHGRMSSDEKDQTMSAFKSGDIDLLVSTTVIEVGVDVANATVMVILDADRFGVSQLHQLRGRVGRGSEPGLCLLVTRSEEESSSMERLKAVAATLDGFELSRVDLEQRREGNVLGASQSGTRSHLRLLRVLEDEAMIISARERATELLAKDPHLDTVPALREFVIRRERESETAFVDKG